MHRCLLLVTRAAERRLRPVFARLSSGAVCFPDCYPRRSTASSLVQPKATTVLGVIHVRQLLVVSALIEPTATQVLTFPDHMPEPIMTV